MSIRRTIAAVLVGLGIGVLTVGFVIVMTGWMTRGLP